MSDIRQCLSRPGKVTLLSCILAFCLLFSNGEQHSRAQDTNGPPPIYVPTLMQDHDPGITWLEPASIDLEPRPNNPPLAIIDQQGMLHLIWDTLTSPRFIFHTKQTQNGWTTPAPVTPSDGTSYTLFAPYVDDQGFIQLVWRNWLGTGIENPYRLLYSSFDGNEWTPEEEVVRFNYELQAMIHSGDVGDVHITFAGSFFFSNIYHTTRTQAGWSNPEEVKPVHTTSLIWPSMQGGIHLYGDDYSGNVHYSYWKNGALQVNDRTIPGRIYGRKSLLDGANNLHLYWTGQVPIPGGQVTGVYHQCLEGNQIFGPQEIPSGSQAISGSVVRTSDQVSKISLSWKEVESKQVRMASWDRCTRVRVRTVPFPEDINLELTSLAMSANPGRVCVVARSLYTTTHHVLCAEVQY
jgi:hypothetical protein